MPSTPPPTICVNFPEDPIYIDGERFEGGGQLFRTALTLSAISGRSVQISHIRASRAKPGIRTQHLGALKAVAQMCDAKVTGDEYGGSEVIFRPGKLKGGRFICRLSGPTSVTLVAQAVLPCMLAIPEESSIEIEGGTDVLQSPTIGYLTEIMLPVIQVGFPAAQRISCRRSRHGFYPKGGGFVEIGVCAGKPLGSPGEKPVVLTDIGEIKNIRIEGFVAGLISATRATKTCHAANAEFREAGLVRPPAFIPPISRDHNAEGDGGVVRISVSTTTSKLLASETLLPREAQTDVDCGKYAARVLLRDLAAAACVDNHMQDQLVVFIAILCFKLQYTENFPRFRCGPISSHTRAVIYVCEAVLGVSFLVAESDGVGVISCLPHKRIRPMSSKGTLGSPRR